MYKRSRITRVKHCYNMRKSKRIKFYLYIEKLIDLWSKTKNSIILQICDRQFYHIFISCKKKKTDAQEYFVSDR